MSFQRKTFVCHVGNIECHGTIEEHTHTRPDTQEEVAYYVVGVVVAGIRRYRFSLIPFAVSGVFEAPYRYIVTDLERLSAVRELVMEALIAPTDQPAFPDLAFEIGLNACVKHYEAVPPRFMQATEHLGEL